MLAYCSSSSASAAARQRASAAGSFTIRGWRSTRGILGWSGMGFMRRAS